MGVVVGVMVGVMVGAMVGRSGSRVEMWLGGTKGGKHCHCQSCKRKDCRNPFYENHARFRTYQVRASVGDLLDWRDEGSDRWSDCPHLARDEGSCCCWGKG